MNGDRRHARLLRHGFINEHGELTATGEHHAEHLAELRAGYWDAPAEFDPPSPDGHGWAPDPHEGGMTI